MTMPMITIEDNGDEFAAALAQFGGDLMPAVGRGALQTAQRIAKRMRTPGSPSVSPVAWDSEKQRRKFFATDGFGGGIPTVRTDAIPDAWEAHQLANGAIVENTAPGAVYVSGDEYGKNQSRIHQGRWPLFSKAVDEELKQLDADVENAIKGAAAKDGVQME